MSNENYYPYFYSQVVPKVLYNIKFPLFGRKYLIYRYLEGILRHFNIFYQKVGTTWEWIFFAAILKPHNFAAET